VRVEHRRAAALEAGGDAGFLPHHRQAFHGRDVDVAVRQPAELGGAGLVLTEDGAVADDDALVEDAPRHARVAVDAGLGEQDRIAHDAAFPHQHTGEEDAALDVSEDAAAVGDDAVVDAGRGPELGRRAFFAGREQRAPPVAQVGRRRRQQVACVL
jgi:hypothetical protein